MAPRMSIKTFFRIFAVVGIVLGLVGAWLVLDSWRYVSAASSVPGEVIVVNPERGSEGEILYRSIVQFVTEDGDAHQFASGFRSNPPAHQVGEAVDVLYFPEAPGQARIKGFFSLWGAAAICALLSVVFAGVGLGVPLVIRLRERRAGRLRQHGRAVEATLVGIEPNGGVSFNGRNPMRIVGQWQNPETGDVHVFFSRNLWFDPTDFVTRRQLRVWIDPQNPRHYTMDTDFLPAKAR